MITRFLAGAALLLTVASEAAHVQSTTKTVACLGQSFRFQIPATWRLASGKCHNGSPTYRSADDAVRVSLIADYANPLGVQVTEVGYMTALGMDPKRVVNRKLKINGVLFDIEQQTLSITLDKHTRLPVTVTLAAADYHGVGYLFLSIVATKASTLDASQAHTSLMSLRLH